MKFYKVMAAPRLLYGSECWELRKKDIRNIETSKIKFLRKCRRLIHYKAE